MGGQGQPRPCLWVTLILHILVLFLEGLQATTPPAPNPETPAPPVETPAPTPETPAPTVPPETTSATHTTTTATTTVLEVAVPQSDHEAESLRIGLIIVSIIAGLAMMVILLGLVYFFRKRQANGRSEHVINNSANSQDAAPVPDLYEVVVSQTTSPEAADESPNELYANTRSHDNAGSLPSPDKTNSPYVNLKSSKSPPQPSAQYYSDLDDSTKYQHHYTHANT